MVRVLCVGQIDQQMANCILPAEWLESWWEKKGQRKFPTIHLITADELGDDPNLESVEFQLLWNWKEQDKVSFGVKDHKKNKFVFGSIAQTRKSRFFYWSAESLAFGTSLRIIAGGIMGRLYQRLRSGQWPGTVLRLPEAVSAWETRTIFEWAS